MTNFLFCANIRRYPIKQARNKTNGMYQKVSSDIAYFMENAGINEAFLFGGAVLDPLIKENPKISDYDICVKDQDDFYEALQNLDRQKFQISEVMRTHNIYVVINHPQLGQIDFSCMDPEDNGIFNIEKYMPASRKEIKKLKIR